MSKFFFKFWFMVYTLIYFLKKYKNKIFHEKGFVIIKKGENVSSLGFDDNKEVMCLTNLLSMQ